MIRITCINKDNGYHDNPHEAISFLGWVEDDTGIQGKWSRIQLYNWIKDQHGIAYVTDAFGHKVYVQTAVSRNLNPFVRTVSDGRETNNLLSLVECR